MRSLDLAVIGLYALAMLVIGRYYKLRVQTADDYLLGDRTMSPWGELGFLWTAPASLLAGIVVGAAVSLISPRAQLSETVAS